MNNPIGLQCEHPNCGASEEVIDFLPLPEDEEDGWESEPVALCPLHCEGRIPVPAKDPALCHRGVVGGATGLTSP